MIQSNHTDNIKIAKTTSTTSNDTDNIKTSNNPEVSLPKINGEVVTQIIN